MWWALSSGSNDSEPAGIKESSCFAWLKHLLPPYRMYEATLGSSKHEHRGVLQFRGNFRCGDNTAHVTGENLVKRGLWWRALFFFVETVFAFLLLSDLKTLIFDHRQSFFATMIMITSNNRTQCDTYLSACKVSLVLSLCKRLTVKLSNKMIQPHVHESRILV